LGDPNSRDEQLILRVQTCRVVSTCLDVHRDLNERQSVWSRAGSGEDSSELKTPGPCNGKTLPAPSGSVWDVGPPMKIFPTFQEKLKNLDFIFRQTSLIFKYCASDP
jgi:hypothetical protein